MHELTDFPVSDIKNGFYFDKLSNRYVCAICGREFEHGEVYKSGDRFFEAGKMAEIHVCQEHGGMFNVLLSFDKRYTGLTDNQKELLTLMGAGLSDKEIAVKIEAAPATIRHQRFVFREKMKQARIYLAICELAFEGKLPPAQATSGAEDLIEIHEGAKMVDDRYCVTKAEEDVILSSMFSSLTPLRLKSLSPKEKKKIVILKRITDEFDKNRRYTEKELNAILKDIYEDFASVRRYLIEYGFMDRTEDCKEYWRR